MDVKFRIAQKDDLPSIMNLIFDDVMAAEREFIHNPLDESYQRAFDEILKDSNNEFIVGELENGFRVACAHMTYIPNLTFKGAARAQVETVRVSSQYRSLGIGEQLIDFCKQRAKERNCRVLQLTTQKIRTDAIRFYKRLGFKNSHEGMKLII